MMNFDEVGHNKLFFKAYISVFRPFFAMLLFIAYIKNVEWIQNRPVEVKLSSKEKKGHLKNSSFHLKQE